MKPVSYLRSVKSELSDAELKNLQDSVARMYDFTEEDYREMNHEIKSQPVDQTKIPTWAKFTIILCNIIMILSGIVLVFVIAFFTWVLIAAFA